MAGSLLNFYPSLYRFDKNEECSPQCEVLRLLCKSHKIHTHLCNEKIREIMNIDRKLAESMWDKEFKNQKTYNYSYLSNMFQFDQDKIQVIKIFIQCSPAKL